MNVGIIVLCRHDSKRLPGKILMEIRGRSLLGIILDRIERGAPGFPVVVATSTDPSDDRIADYCRRSGVACYRGPLDDVAGRFLGCAEHFGLSHAARINGDNVFVDPMTLNAMLAIAQTGQFDLVTNVPGRTFPFGMSIEIVDTAFYRQAMAQTADPGHREHVTSWLYERPELGRRHVVENRLCPQAAGLQLAIDTAADLDRARGILDCAGPDHAGLGLRQVYQLATRGTTASPWQGASGPLLIAEIGGNHEGDFESAKAMTASAIASGVDCIKFQIYTGDTLVSPVESPDRNRHFKRFELSPEQHIELACTCRDAGVSYLASVWDGAMLDWIDPYLDFYKIGSGDLTAWPLLEAFARRGKPMLLSTGLATLDEVLQTVQRLRRVDARYGLAEHLCLLQCTSMYPIPDGDAQLRVMDTLRAATGLAVGYSDHTEGSSALRAAAAMGAQALEFHFTDRREGRIFRDHKVSLTGEEVRDLMRDIAQITAFRGQGVKRPQASELAERHEVSFRRGVYVRRPIQAGEAISSQDLALLRPAHGTDARDFDLLVGARALRPIEPYRAIAAGVDFEPSHDSVATAMADQRP